MKAGKKILDYFSILLLLTGLTINAQAQNAGDLDPSFGSGGIVGERFHESAYFSDVVVQPDGKIVVVGSTFMPTSPLGAHTGMIARFNSDGTLDLSFDEDGYNNNFIMKGINTVVLQPDGKILIGGLEQTGNANHMAVARFNPDGSLDETFNGTGKVITTIGTESVVTSMQVLSNGKIIAAGYARITGNLQDIAMIRLNADGTLDTGFGTNGRVATHLYSQDYSYDSAIQADGKIILVGYTIEPVANQKLGAILRYNPDGTLDTDFGDGGKTFRTETGNAESRGIAVQSDGKLIVVGNGHPPLRYNSDGTFDTAFDSLGVYSYSVLLQPDAKILVGGFSLEGGSGYFAVARYNSDGTVDTGFGNSGKTTTAFSNNTWVKSMALQPDGKIIAGGDVYPYLHLVRYLNDNSTVGGWMDFDGDGKTDISIFRPSNAEWWYSRSSDNNVFAAQFGMSTDRVVPADFTGDGRTDVAVWRESSGQWFVLRSEDYSYYAFPFGTAGDIPVPGDFDGDGRADAAVFRPSNATWYILRSSDGGITIQQFGVSEDRPVVADYDGDGTDDIAVYRPSNSEWWINRSSGGTVGLQFGAPGDRTVPGDYTGDGKTDAAVYRPATGEWFILRSEDNSYYAFTFGTAGDLPTPGDYDGDGRMDAAVFRPSNAVWYLQRSTSGFTAVAFGSSADMPVPSAFVE